MVVDGLSLLGQYADDRRRRSRGGDALRNGRGAVHASEHVEDAGAVLRHHSPGRCRTRYGNPLGLSRSVRRAGRIPCIRHAYSGVRRLSRLVLRQVLLGDAGNLIAHV